MRMEEYEAVTDILDLLARAYKYDDKPHQLYSYICVLAEKYVKDFDRRKEIIRLMDKEYNRDRSKKD